MEKTFLQLEGLGKAFGKNTVVDDVNLSIGQGEFVSFLGPSGCGKTTVLRMIAGFETPTTGRIVVNGRDVTSLRPNQRKIGMVFQAYALFPNMSVAANIGFGLRVGGVAKDEARERIGEMLTLIGLSGFEKRYPYQLSGGQQQRVALARALAARPAMLLLDEPLSALDAKIRLSLREEIRAIQKKLDITTIFVTHDQEEALSMSDRVVVMRDGHAEQIGTPFEIYNRPATRFVANFVGTLNVLEGTVSDAATGKVRLGAGEVVLKDGLDGARNGDALALALRPEAIALGPRVGNDGRLTGEIMDVHFLGSVIRVRVGLGKEVVSLDTFNNSTTPPPKVGDKAEISFSCADLLVLN
ncbi:ABC transporter ATP-binding protein [Manganibacter manganicus]|uniref:Spermidine/putrescine ABC transporter ATP-binding protein n=1 Tax=Manganibacter manganicus TaxID=1873176 RepID=A0A1V8RSE2_9HYPH|nr:ABC transporter ATP-binding protein [Pseudaminobacter manganicus]OQM76097.1 spermidine/putrescine ABC transporter ATP-binding protein [Pseudaminobacter manganicus]